MGQIRNFMRNGQLCNTDGIRVATTQRIMEDSKGEKVVGEAWMQYDDL